MAHAGHQGFIEFIDPVLQEVGSRNRAGAFEGVGVERVERAERHDLQGAALGGVRVYPVEMGKGGGVLECAELRIAWLSLRFALAVKLKARQINSVRRGRVKSEIRSRHWA